MLKCKPLRNITANKVSSTIFFYSRKKQRQIKCESTLEWSTAIVIEHEPLLIDYCEQAIELKWSRSNWTADFVVLLENEENSYDILIIEVKYLKDLLADQDHFKMKYSESIDWIRENKNKIISQITNFQVRKIEFLVVTDQIINQSFRMQNLRELMEASVDPAFIIELSRHIKAILSKNPNIEIKQLVKSISLRNLPEGTTEDEIWTGIYEMIYYFDLIIDLEQHLSPKSKINLPNGSFNYESINIWLKKFNWENQNIVKSIIPHLDLYALNDNPKKSIELWEIANKRYEIIIDLIKLPIKQLQLKEFKFEGHKYHWRTIHNWILAYKRSKGDISSLIPSYCDRGKKKVQDNNTKELFEIGKEAYLKSNRSSLSKKKPIAKKSISQSYKIMKAYAKRNSKIKYCMSYSTFYRKIKNISPKLVTEFREGTKVAEHKFELSEGEFPHGDYALQSVQIDHTPIDVLVVDEEQRKVTERPYLTVAFDSHTRCILGYYITYDKPSRLSVGMTLLNCIKTKKETIAKIRNSFPNLDPQELKSLETSGWLNIYGLPFTLHMDNGSDFRSEDIILFGLSYKVHLHYRPVGKTQFGAYVERFLGTLNKRLHSLPGTTSSNIKERGDYPSEDRAIFTIEELEARVITEIIYYHHDIHRELYMTPLAKWNESFTAIGTRALNRNLSLVKQSHFKFDVLPSDERTVQKKGVEIFNLHYTNPLIQKFIGIKNLKNKKKSKKFRIRYDPRDITKILFIDNTDKNNCQYIPLVCNDKFVQENYIKKKQILSLWAWNAIKNDFEIKGKQYYDQNVLLDIVNLQQDMENIALKRTKTARKLEARKKRREKDSREIINTVSISYPKTNEVIIKKKSQPKQVIRNFGISKTTKVKKIKLPAKNSSRFANLDQKTAKNLAKNLNRRK